MDLKVPITITDELSDDTVGARASLNLASGEISGVEYIDYDAAADGLPWERDDYEFSSGSLANDGKDVEFRVDVDRVTGRYSVTANELLEIKVRAAALFAGVSAQEMLDRGRAQRSADAAGGATGRPGGGRRRGG